MNLKKIFTKKDRAKALVKTDVISSFFMDEIILCLGMVVGLILFIITIKQE